MAAGNRERVLESIFRRESVSQRQLVSHTGLKASTISNIIRDFKQNSIIRECGILESSRVGPKEIALEIDNTYCYAASLSMDNSGYELCLANASGHIMGSEKIGPDVPYQEVLASLPQRIKAQAEAWGVASRRFAGLGVCISGVIDSASGVVLYSRAMKMKNVNLRKILEDSLGVPVLMERNIQCGAYMEQFHGSARQHSTFIYYLLRRDALGELEQGMGLVIDRKNYRGYNSAAGELDFFFSPEDVSLDPSGPGLDQFYQSFCPALAAIINLVDPGCLVICSDEQTLSQKRFEALKQGIIERLLPVPGRQFSVVRSSLGLTGMLTGACLMTVHRCLHDAVSSSQAAETSKRKIAV